MSVRLPDLSRAVSREKEERKANDKDKKSKNVFTYLPGSIERKILKEKADGKGKKSSGFLIW